MRSQIVVTRSQTEAMRRQTETTRSLTENESGTMTKWTEREIGTGNGSGRLTKQTGKRAKTGATIAERNWLLTPRTRKVSTSVWDLDESIEVPGHRMSSSCLNLGF